MRAVIDASTVAITIDRDVSRKCHGRNQLTGTNNRDGAMAVCVLDKECRSNCPRSRTRANPLRESMRAYRRIPSRVHRAAHAAIFHAGVDQRSRARRDVAPFVHRVHRLIGGSPVHVVVPIAFLSPAQCRAAPTARNSATANASRSRPAPASVQLDLSRPVAARRR